MFIIVILDEIILLITNFHKTEGFHYSNNEIPDILERING